MTGVDMDYSDVMCHLDFLTRFLNEARIRNKWHIRIKWLGCSDNLPIIPRIARMMIVETKLIAMMRRRKNNRTTNKCKGLISMTILILKESITLSRYYSSKLLLMCII